MPTSASCRRRRSKHRGLRPAASGFSLLELLVVLALISVMTALVAPRLQGTVDAITTSGERAEVKRQLERLPLIARQQGHPIEFGVDQDVVGVIGVELPAGWKVRSLTALTVAGNGVCNAARLRVEGRETVEEWAVAAPDCSVDNGN